MDLRRADLGLLVSLDALLSERSVTAAARKLGISQPALSAQLARLRDMLGDEILVGNAHGMAPTPRAESLQAPLHNLLQDMSQLIFSEIGFDPATSDRHFHLAASEVVLAAILPLLVQQLGRLAPGIRLTTGRVDETIMMAASEGGKLDLVVAATSRMPASFQSIALGHRPNIVIWREGHPVLTDHITLDQFCTLPQINPTPIEGRFDGPIDEILLALGRRRNVRVAISNYALLPALVRNSDFIAVTPWMVDFDSRGLVSAPLPFEQVPVVMHLGWHPRFRNDPAHRWFRELFIQTTRKLIRQFQDEDSTDPASAQP